MHNSFSKKKQQQTSRNMPFIQANLLLNSIHSFVKCHESSSITIYNILYTILFHSWFFLFSLNSESEEISVHWNDIVILVTSLPPIGIVEWQAILFWYMCDFFPISIRLHETMLSRLEYRNEKRVSICVKWYCSLLRLLLLFLYYVDCWVFFFISYNFVVKCTIR